MRGVCPAFLFFLIYQIARIETNFPCVFVVMLDMTTQAQVSGTELKVRIEKALNEKGEEAYHESGKGAEWGAQLPPSQCGSTDS